MAAILSPPQCVKLLPLIPGINELITGVVMTVEKNLMGPPHHVLIDLCADESCIFPAEIAAWRHRNRSMRDMETQAGDMPRLRLGCPKYR